jgi:hypothetical protein
MRRQTAPSAIDPSTITVLPQSPIFGVYAIVLRRRRPLLNEYLALGFASGVGLPAQTLPHAI